MVISVPTSTIQPNLILHSIFFISFLEIVSHILQVSANINQQSIAILSTNDFFPVNLWKMLRSDPSYESRVVVLT